MSLLYFHERTSIAAASRSALGQQATCLVDCYAQKRADHEDDKRWIKICGGMREYAHRGAAGAPAQPAEEQGRAEGPA